MKPKFKKILIANRGEIAVRISKSLKKMGIESHTIHSLSDKNSLHTKLSDHTHSFDSDDLHKSYLDIEKIIKIAKVNKIDAIHPGYGFLSENYDFAKKLTESNIVFIGPDYKSMRALGDKVNSKTLAAKLKIPTLEVQNVSKKTSFPVVIKASAGGGGRGMRVLRNFSEFENAWQSAKREAKAAFNNDTLFVERYLENVRHIEVQIIADVHGNIRHIFDRDCSLQRNHQKVIEEAPAFNIPNDIRNKMYKSAIKLCTAAKYNNLATVEFLLDKNNNFYFLEVNTRLQVEHTVSEEISNLDFVELQILIAAGYKLKELLPDTLIANGHAIQYRICAESPENNFAPDSGELKVFDMPKIDNVRLDSGVEQGSFITFQYDSLVAKLIIHEVNRDTALNSGTVALKELKLFGIKSNLAFLSIINQTKEFKNASVYTKFIDKFLNSFLWKSVFNKIALEFLNSKILSMTNNHDIWSSNTNWRLDGQSPCIKGKYLINDTVIVSTEVEYIQPDIAEFKSHYENAWFQSSLGSIKICEVNQSKTEKSLEHKEINTLKSSLPGKIVKVCIKKGAQVKAGQELVILESMKMEHVIRALGDRIVKKINFQSGDFVSPGSIIIEFETK